MKLYSEDNTIYTALSKLGDLIFLNVCFVVSCLPIITIGASLTALSAVTNKLNKSENTRVLTEFKENFMKNFKQTTLIWMCILFAIMIIALDIQILGVLHNNILLGMIIGVSVLIFIFASYLFPLIACFENTTFIMVKNAIIIALLNSRTTICILLLNAVPLLILVSSGIITQIGYFFYLLIGFSLTSLWGMKLLSKVFNKYQNNN